MTNKRLVGKHSVPIHLWETLCRYAAAKMENDKLVFPVVAEYQDSLLSSNDENEQLRRLDAVPDALLRAVVSHALLQAETPDYPEMVKGALLNQTFKTGMYMHVDNLTKIKE